MKPTRTRLAMVIVGGIVCGTMAWTSMAWGQRGGADNEHLADVQGFDPEAGDDGRRSFNTVMVTDRGNTRSIWMLKSGSGSSGFHPFTPEQEMDVSQIVITNGTWSANRASSFGFELRSAEPTIMFSAASGEFGTKTIVFPLPLAIREGDEILYGRYVLPGETLHGNVQLTFIGTIPESGVDSLSVH